MACQGVITLDRIIGHTGVAEWQLDSECDDLLLSDIAELTVDYRKYSPRLGVKDPDIKDLEQKFMKIDHSIKLITAEVFKLWHKNKKYYATYRVLAEVALALGDGAGAEKICQIICAKGIEVYFPGMKSLEYKALVQCYPTLVSCLQLPVHTSFRIFFHKILSKRERSFFDRGLQLDSKQRAHYLMETVLHQVKIDPEVYRIFIQGLTWNRSNPQFERAISTLKDTYDTLTSDKETQVSTKKPGIEVYSLGMKSPEYKALVQCYPTLFSFLQQSVYKIFYLLFDILSKKEGRFLASGLPRDSKQRAHYLLESVLLRVKFDPELYHTFIASLNMGGITSKLETATSILEAIYDTLTSDKETQVSTKKPDDIGKTEKADHYGTSQVIEFCKEFELNSEDIDNEVSNEHILEIYRWLKNWEEVAVNLGLTLEDIKAKAQQNTQLQQLHTLLEWKKKEKAFGRATYRFLLEALLQARCTELAAQLCYLITSQVPQKKLASKSSPAEREAPEYQAIVNLKMDLTETMEANPTEEPRKTLIERKIISSGTSNEPVELVNEIVFKVKVYPKKFQWILTIFEEKCVWSKDIVIKLRKELKEIMGSKPSEQHKEAESHKSKTSSIPDVESLHHSVLFAYFLADSGLLIDNAFTKLSESDSAKLKDWKKKSESEIIVFQHTTPEVKSIISVTVTVIEKGGKKLLKFQPSQSPVNEYSKELLQSFHQAIVRFFETELKETKAKIKFGLLCPMPTQDDGPDHICTIIQLYKPYFLWCKQHKEIEFEHNDNPPSLLHWFPEVETQLREIKLSEQPYRRYVSLFGELFTVSNEFFVKDSIVSTIFSACKCLEGNLNIIGVSITLNTVKFKSKEEVRPALVIFFEQTCTTFESDDYIISDQNKSVIAMKVMDKVNRSLLPSTPQIHYSCEKQERHWITFSAEYPIESVHSSIREFAADSPKDKKSLVNRGTSPEVSSTDSKSEHSDVQKQISAVIQPCSQFKSRKLSTDPSCKGTTGLFVHVKIMNESQEALLQSHFGVTCLHCAKMFEDSFAIYENYRKFSSVKVDESSDENHVCDYTVRNTSTCHEYVGKFQCGYFGLVADKICWPCEDCQKERRQFSCDIALFSIDNPDQHLNPEACLLNKQVPSSHPDYQEDKWNILYKPRVTDLKKYAPEETLIYIYSSKESQVGSAKLISFSIQNLSGAVDGPCLIMTKTRFFVKGYSGSIIWIPSKDYMQCEDCDYDLGNNSTDPVNVIWGIFSQISKPPFKLAYGFFLQPALDICVSILFLQEALKLSSNNAKLEEEVLEAINKWDNKREIKAGKCLKIGNLTCCYTACLNSCQNSQLTISTENSKCFTVQAPCNCT